MFHLYAMFLHARDAVGVPLALMYVRRLCCAVPRGTSALCVDGIFGWIHRVYGFCSPRVHRRLFASSAAPHIFFAFSEAQGYCFCAFSSGWRCAQCLTLSFALRLVSVDHFSAASRVAMS